MKKAYRQYSKTNTDYDKMEGELQYLEEKYNIEIATVLETDESGIYPVLKINRK